MKTDDNPQKRGKTPSMIRSSAAEYLTFVAAAGDSETSVEMRYEDENIWLTQKMMATLYGVSVPAINQHLKRIFDDNELQEPAVVKEYLITASDGKNYQVKHYNLQAIIAVGFKIENERAVQFRKWANQIIKDYTIQGWIMDVDRLKNGGLLTDEFFERQLEKIREIRLSERKFYQKVTDIYATALDYDPTASATKRFFAAVQNKLHFAFHGQTASEVIVDRADHQKKNMGLATWEGAPEGKIHKYDVSIAKNYLSEFPWPFYAASPPCCPPLTRIWSAITGSSQIAPGTARPCHTRQPGPRTPGGTTRLPGIASSQMSRSPQNPGSSENAPTCHGPACCEGPCMSMPFPVPGAPHPWSYSPF